MRERQRIVLGCLGALVPSLAVLYGINSLESLDGKWMLFGIKAIVVVVAGGLMAYVQTNVQSRAAALQIGMAIPGILSGLLASPELRNIYNDAQASQTISDRPAPSPPPAPPANQDQGSIDIPSTPWWPFEIAVHAEDKVKPVSRNVGLLERIGLVTKRNWYVVVESYPVLRWAQTAQGRYGKAAQIVQHKQDGRTLFVLVDGEGLSYDEAAARAKRPAKGFKPYPWNPNLSLAAPAGCATEEIEEGDVEDLEIGWGNRPLYAWISPMSVNNAFAVCLAVSKPVKDNYPNQAAFLAAARGGQCQSLKGIGNGRDVTLNAEGYSVAVSKIDWDRPGKHDLDLTVCRIS